MKKVSFSKSIVLSNFFSLSLGSYHSILSSRSETVRYLKTKYLKGGQDLYANKIIEPEYYTKLELRNKLIGAFNVSGDVKEYIRQEFFCDNFMGDFTYEVVCSKVATHSSYGQIVHYAPAAPEVILTVKSNLDSDFGMDYFEYIDIS